jgi:ubiquinone/menaquinone biosynthesis C-methylase UbiE/DNA-binding MarR family transcriptional regulator
MRTATILAVTRAIGEPTRLRILALLAAGERTVKDLTVILGQSQPRISHHLKLLAEAGLVDRFRDGSWVYLHLAEGSEAADLTRRVLAGLDGEEVVLVRDRERADRLEAERVAAAQDYFRRNAAEWNRIRALHVAEAEVEAAMRATLGEGPFETFLDLGTGTGRVLELFADRYVRGLGLDINRSMLAAARANLERAGLAHARVRHGDLAEVALPDGFAEAIVVHQVLHYLADPQHALAEAARVLAPGGRLLVVDFAPHDLEFLREQHAHARLGLADAQVRQWLAEAGLTVLDTTLLEPEAGAGPDKLTVSLWLAGKRAVEATAVAASRTRAPHMEISR